MSELDDPGEERRWRPPAFAFWIAGGLAAVVAVADRSAPMFLLAVPLLIAPLTAWSSLPNLPSVSRLAWSAAGEGRTVVVEGRLALPKEIPGDVVELGFSPPDAFVASGLPEVTRSPGELRFRWSMVAARPCLGRLPIPGAVWRDPLGLAEVTLPIDGAALPVERFPPEVSRLRTSQLRRTTVFPGEVRSRERGPGGEFFALRASQPGDTPREINWVATARRGALVANEFRRERTGDLLLVLDLRPTPLGARRDAELLALGRAAAFGIAQAFLHEKARVGLATFGEFPEIVPLGSGRLQQYRIRALLQRAAVAAAPGPAERLAVSLRRRVSPGVGTLVISSLAGDDDELLLTHLRRRGFAPFVLSPSPLPLLLERQEAAPDSAADVAARLLRLRRRQRLASVWKEAPVLEWDDYWSLAGLVRFLERPIERRAGGG